MVCTIRFFLENCVKPYKFGSQITENVITAFVSLISIVSVDQNQTFLSDRICFANCESNLTAKLIQFDTVFKKKSYCAHHFACQKVCTKINLAARVTLWQCTNANQTKNSGQKAIYGHETMWKIVNSSFTLKVWHSSCAD